MRNLVISFLLLLLPISIFSQEEICVENEICVVYFNASFNKANGIDWMPELTDCVSYDVDIMEQSDLQKEHKIVVVPTILILDGGVEVARFQANIMMTMEATREEVQESIDEIIMSKF
tara:strand:+ start:3303 stop:3656 length:354 start_codon:yes stop_codon:yes gene_type:complete